MSPPPSRFVLLAAGSNARGQLASSTYEDAHAFQPCLFLDDDDDAGATADSALPSRVRGIRKLVCGANHALLMLEVEVDASSGNVSMSISGTGAASTLEATSTTPTSISTSTANAAGSTPAPARAPRRTCIELWGSGDGSRGQLGAAYQAAQARGAFATTSVFRRLEVVVPGASASAAGALELEVRDVAAAWETSYVVFGGGGGSDSDVVVAMGSDEFGALGGGGGGGGGEDGEVVVPIERVLPRSKTSTASADGQVVRVLSIAASFRHVFAHISLDNSNHNNSNNNFNGTNSNSTYLLSWGAHRHGQRGPKASSPLPTLTPSHGTTQIALGKEHTLILDESGRVSGLGSDRKGQLRGLERVEGAVHVGCTWAGTFCVVRRYGVAQVFAAGDNARGQLGRGAAGPGPGYVGFPFSHESKGLEGLACGSEHVLALFAARTEGEGEGEEGDGDREVWGWGWNEHGNLGLGHTEDVLRPTRIWPPPDPSSATAEMVCGRVLNVWGGCGTSWIAVQKL
ncbi:RCC1 BLIP-II [Coniophora puteana RWD-64-598 SS2]|uniref:RCC1 BLIP-II n=1 Tax=Coniophora puteana (strain RWD-64-598) TaxID=741705 RepID=A0A5M3N8Y5_CONPW|nr:RCC1 BLIP-II [Coniophora puteana RWD-64-598 SS2]EIW87311.1 RCC1 BLIP-II [Coniophora puteana RWD-64-598 SS2]